MHSFRSAIALLAASCLIVPASAWAPTQGVSRKPRSPPFAVGGSTSSPTACIITQLHSSRAASSVSDESSASSTPETPSNLSESEQKIVADIYSKGRGGDDALKEAVLAALPTMPPKLLVKLRQATTTESSSSSSDPTPTKSVISQVSQALNTILNERLETARETLRNLLNAGEVRKLDGLIGHAARAGNLDAAFFNVLTINIRDAAEDEKNNPPKEPAPEDEPTASRLQILQHIYTRCQEEVEKTIAPGMALLNKLLRTEQESIRANLYSHYLTPQSNVIETPDGKKVELKSNEPNKVRVPIEEFVAAIDKAVLQVRNVQKAGGTDAASAAAMVEGCRQIAKEARIVIGRSYGVESEALQVFENGLQPVFRPSSADSPYIQGDLEGDTP